MLCKKLRGRWRWIEKTTQKIAKNARGTPVDGGGHMDKKQAMAQMQSMNMGTTTSGY